MKTRLAVATLLAGLAAAPLASAQGAESQPSMMGDDMQGMMRMMAEMGTMMQAAADQPDMPATPRTEDEKG